MIRFVCLALLAACAAEPVAVELPARPEPVRTKERQSLGARLLDAQGRDVAGQPIAFESDDEKVVRVEADGSFACLRSGVAVVTLKSRGLRAETSITCAIAERISVPEAVVLVVGEAPRPLDVKVLNSTGGVLADAPLTLTSREESVARVEGDRLVPVASGRAEVLIASGSVKTSATVQVVEVGTLELPPTLVVAVGGGRPLPVKLLDRAGAELAVPVKLSSSDERLVTTVDHKLVGHGFGVAKVRASVGATSSESDVLVVERHPARPFEVPPSSLVRIPLEPLGHYLVSVSVAATDDAPITARIEGADCETAGPGRKLELACEVTEPATLVLQNPQRAGRAVTGTYTVVRSPRAVEDRSLVWTGVQER